MHNVPMTTTMPRTTTNTRRAGLYCRISSDKEGAGLGVARQEADCRELAGTLGWEVAGVYVDNDISASTGTPRPEYRRLLADIDAGVLTALVCWHNDRLHRRPDELEAFIDLVETRGVAVHMVKSGQMDLATPSGRMVARMLGAAARYEVEHKKDRQRRKARELAEAGQLGGGGPRPYGYEADRLTIRPGEAAVIRDVAARVLAGEPVRAVVRSLNDAGISSSTGNAWRVTTLTRLLGSPRIAGQRQHYNGERGKRPAVFGPEDGAVYPAVWPAIISPADSLRLRTMLSGGRGKRGAPARYLLTGILRCAKCHQPMRGQPKQDGQRRYTCHRLYEYGSEAAGVSTGCGTVFVSAAHIEPYLIELVAVALSGGGLARRLAQRDTDGQSAEVLAAIGKDEKALDRLGNDLDDGLITRAEWQRRSERLHDRVRTQRATLARNTGAGPLAAVQAAGGFRAYWSAGATTDEARRAVLAAVLATVEIGPAVRGRNTFDPARVGEPVWVG